MFELVSYLAEHWEALQNSQRQRQLLMAVTTGDVPATRRLLYMGVDPNVQDTQGLTCMHAAARARELAVVKALVHVKGDLNIPDNQTNLPIHMLGLFVTGPTIELFKELAHTQALLEAPNSSGVTPIQRFAAWALTGAQSKPFQPAMDLVSELQKQYPTMKMHGQTSDAMFAGLTQGTVSESSLELNINGKKRSVLVLEPPGSNIEAFIVYVSLPCFIPISLQKQAVETIAKYLCASFKAKMFVLYEDSFDIPQIKSIEDWGHEMSSVIEALPFQGKFVFVDNSLGKGIPSIWKLESRLSACVIINPFAWFNDEFYGSPAHKGLVQIITASLQPYADRNVDECVKTVGNVCFAESTGDIDRAVSLYKEAMKFASDNWWLLQLYGVVHLQDFQPFCKSLPKLGEVPVVLLCGSFSSPVMVRETASRFAGIMLNAGISYIQDSNMWFEVEGEIPIKSVAHILTEVMHHEGRPFKVSELLAKTALHQQLQDGPK
mmetsp:Transcript_50116/g.161086  ORF Transcript_50116/g.161086 Transcript_50116/m.161086 type:complete len:491 (-) Transcript_50116:108-1580(-)